MMTVCFTYAAEDWMGPVALFTTYGDARAFIDDWNAKAERLVLGELKLAHVRLTVKYETVTS